MGLVFKSFTLRSPGITAEDKTNFMRLAAFFLEFHRLYNRMYARATVI